MFPVPLILSLSKDELKTMQFWMYLLRYAEVFDTRDDAFRRERQIKGWSRAKKEALEGEDWQALQQLAQTAHPRSGRS